MFRYIAKRFVMFLFICLSAIGFTPSSAQAEAPSTTITSSYDASNPDNLKLSYMHGAASCDDIVNTNAWTSEIDVANLADNTNLSVSIETGKGGTIEPHGYGTLYAHGNGFTAVTVTLSFLFEADGTSGETTTFTVPAPDNGCQGKGGGSSVNCYLNNYTDPSVVDEDGSWPLGTTFNLTAHVTDTDSRVVHIVFSFLLPGSKSNDIQSGPDASMTWAPTDAGTWKVVAQLFDANGDEVTPTGDCDIQLIMKAQASAPKPKTPTNTGTTATGSSVPPPSEAVATTAQTSASGNGSVKASAPTLPVTGARTTLLLTTGLALIIGGGLLQFFGRQRKQPFIDPEWLQALE